MDDATVGNWVGQFTNTTGQGPIVISGTIKGYTSFESIAGDGVDFWYAIVDGDNREAGIGTYDGGFFYRNQVFSTLVNGQYFSGAATPLDLSGSAEIYSTFNKTAFDDFVTHVNTVDIHFSDAPVDGIQYARQDGGWTVVQAGDGGGSGGGSTEISILQPGHGFSVLDCVRFDDPSTGYVLALADDAATLAIGVVVAVQDVDNFTLSLTGIYNFSHGLTEEQWWYLSDTVPGGLTLVEPPISQPIVYTEGPSRFIVAQYRPSEPTGLAIFGGAGQPGIVPDPITEQGYVLSDDGTWVEQSGGGQVDSVVGGTDITVDSSDPVNPIVNFSGTIPPPFVPDTFAGPGTTGYVPDPVNGLGYYLADDGTFKPVPVSPVGALFIYYRWSSATTGPAPAGDILANNADQTLATELYASGESQPGNDLNFVWQNTFEGEFIGIWEAGGESVYYFVTADPTYDAGNNSWTVPVSRVTGAGGIDNNRTVQAFFLANPSEKIPRGGTTGQVLTKNSDADFDDSWQDPAGGESYWEPGTNPDDIVNTNTGKVGVGVEDPITEFHMKGTFLLESDTSQYLYTRATDTAQIPGRTLGSLSVQGTSPNGTVRNIGACFFQSTATPWTDSSMPTNWNVSLAAEGAVTPTLRMRIDSQGRCGIGVAEPLVALHSIAIGETPEPLLPKAANAALMLESATSNTVLQLSNSGVGRINIHFGDMEDASAGRIQYDHSADAMVFATSGSINERMRIAADGRVGIGVNDPSVTLDIASPASYPTLRIRDDLGPGISLNNKDLTANWTIQNQTGQQNALRFNYNGSNKMLLSTDGDVMVGRTLTTSRFHSQAEDSQAAGEFYRPTTIGSTAVGVFRSNVSGTETICFRINADGTTATSDERLKTNMVTTKHGLDDVLALNPIEFDWTASGERSLGFGAQSLGKIIPLAAHYDAKEDLHSVYESRLIPVLVKAIQELTARVEELEAME